MREDPAAVLPHQRRDDMHVAVGMPDRHPPHPKVVIAAGQPDPVQVLLRDVGPLSIGQVRSTGAPVPGSFAAAIARW